jgi:plexin A
MLVRFQQFIVQARFVCQFNIDGRVVMKSGQLLGDTIYCDKTRFSYNSLSPNLTASFAVIWGNSKSLDNPKHIHSTPDLILSRKIQFHGILRVT